MVYPASGHVIVVSRIVHCLQRGLSSLAVHRFYSRISVVLVVFVVVVLKCIFLVWGFVSYCFLLCGCFIDLCIVITDWAEDWTPDEWSGSVSQNVVIFHCVSNFIIKWYLLPCDDYASPVL